MTRLKRETRGVRMACLLLWREVVGASIEPHHYPQAWEAVSWVGKRSREDEAWAEQAEDAEEASWELNLQARAERYSPEARAALKNTPDPSACASGGWETEARPAVPLEAVAARDLSPVSRIRLLGEQSGVKAVNVWATGVANIPAASAPAAPAADEPAAPTNEEVPLDAGCETSEFFSAAVDAGCSNLIMIVC